METLEALRVWWEDRSRMEGMSDHFFLTSTGRRVSNTGVRTMLSGYCRRAYVPKEKAHPHALRHTFATTFLKKGGNLSVLQKILGHSSLQVTSVYCHDE